ncbi:MAG: hypothetical protein ACRDUY_03755 [Nitriliruptorales bacterium]
MPQHGPPGDPHALAALSAFGQEAPPPPVEPVICQNCGEAIDPVTGEVVA